MDAALATTHADEILNGNLSVLRAVDEAAARAIDAAEPPHEIEQTIAHDGSPTFAFNDEAGRWRWFGDSGAPRVRAEALASAFDIGIGNALLVGVGQGALVTELLRRLARHQALVVLEPDPVNLRLALSLHDWRDALRAGRLVIVPVAGVSPADALTASLLQRPGHLVPDRIFKWPWMTASDVQAAAEAARTALDRVESARNEELNRCASALRAGAGRRNGVLVCATSLDWEHAQLAKDICAEMLTAGHACQSFTARLPGRRHRLDLMRELSEFNPAGLVLIDRPHADIASCLPDDLPVVTWFADGRLDAADGRASVTVPLGVPRRATNATNAAPASSRHPVVVFADGAPTAAAAYGIEIDSHIKLWDALTAMLRLDAASRLDANLTDTLRAAERKTGIRITDGDLRRRFLELGQRRLWPTVWREHILSRLDDAGVLFALFGRGWPSGSHWHARLDGPPPQSAPELESVVAETLLIDLNAGATVNYSQLIAVAAGAVVIRPARDDGSPWKGVFDSSERPPTWRTADELLALARDWPTAGRAAAWRHSAAPPRRLADAVRDLLAALPSAAPRTCD